MKGLTKLVTLFCLGIILQQSVQAEWGSLVYKAQQKNSQFPPELMNVQREQDGKDKFYQDFFGKLDADIERTYHERWWYHEKQVNYGLPWWRREVIGFGNLDTFGRGPFEGDVRKDYAREVLRMRIDSGIREVLYQIKNPTIVNAHQTFKKTVDAINNYPLRLSSKPGNKAGEFRLGYDLLSDSSRIEYLQGMVQLGVYHPQLFGCLTRQQPWDIGSFVMTTNFGTKIPAARLTVPLHRKTVEGSLSQSISDSVSATFRTSQPLRDQTQPHTYYAEIAYRF